MAAARSSVKSDEKATARLQSTGTVSGLPGAEAMIAGLNRVLEHAGKQYHIQVEDLGEAEARFEVRVHSGGGVIWQKKMGYAETLGKGLSRAERDDEIRTAMEKALHTVEAAIARGKLPGLG